MKQTTVFSSDLLPPQTVEAEGFTGAEQRPVAAGKQCPFCEGKGIVIVIRRTGMEIERCPDCQGIAGGNAAVSHLRE